MYSKLTLIFTLLLCSCAVVNINTKDLPPKSFVPSQRSVNSNPQIIRQNEVGSISKPYYCVMELRVWGNNPSTENDLMNRLKLEALKQNVDLVIRSDLSFDTSNSQSFYVGYGISQTSPIRLPFIDSFLCNFAMTYVGIKIEKNGVVSYVSDNSPASKAGIKEGMKILKYNNTFVENNPFANALEISTKKPGDKLLIEFLDLKGNKIKKEVILEAII